jgi:two-component system, cell cycle sensor histidine kinase and response regulator CckA
MSLSHYDEEPTNELGLETEPQATFVRNQQYWANLITDQIEEVFFSLDTNWYFTYLNHRAASVLGRARETLLGKSIWQEFPSLLGSNFEKFYRQTMAEGKPNHLEEFSPTAQAWYEVRAYRIPQGLIVSFQDITERKRTEQQLRESEQRYRVLSEASFEAIVIHRNGIPLEINQSAARIFGYASPEEMLRYDVSQVVAPESLAEIRKRIAEGFEESYEVIGVRKDGSRFPVEGLGKPIDYAGQPARVIALRDITERKRIDQQLRDSEIRYKVLGEASYEGLALYADGIIIETNQRLAAMFGYTMEEFIGMPLINLIAPEGLVEFKERVAAKYSGTAQNIGLRKDGSRFFFEVRGKEIEYQGRMVRAVALRDLTELKQAEEALQKTQAQLVQAQKMESIGRLAGGVAHDFNNLLTAIMGYTELILFDLTEAAPIYSDVIEIQSAANRAATLTRQLLAFSRQQILQPRVLKLNEVVANMDKLLHRLLGEDIELFSLLAPDLGEVLADPGQLEQVILNLAINARDAMPDGGKLAIETANVELDAQDSSIHYVEIKPGSYVVLTVRDTGVGMDRAIQEKIFEPFFTTKEIGKGTGLGLSTVYGIVKQSDGYISVYSEVGLGTVFKVYLPRTKTATSDQEATSNPPKAGDSVPTALQINIAQITTAQNNLLTTRVQSYTVLVVEDDVLLRALIRRVLSMAGYKIVEAANGYQALELLEKISVSIDLVLTDIIMPQMGGRELIEKLRERWPDLKVLCMSGYTDHTSVRHGILQHCTNFLQKPFTPDVLLNRIEEVLQILS